MVGSCSNSFEKNPDIAAIQPKILDYNRKNFFEFAGAGGGLIDNLGYPYCRGRVLKMLRRIKVSIMMKQKFSGLPDVVCLSAPKILESKWF